MALKAGCDLTCGSEYASLTKAVNEAGVDPAHVRFEEFAGY